MTSLINFLNSTGDSFCRFALAMLIQSGILIAVLYLIDRLIRKHVRAVFRYGIWMLVFVKLVLPPALSLPTGVGYWFEFDILPAGNQASTEIPEQAADRQTESLPAQYEFEHSSPATIVPDTHVPAQTPPVVDNRTPTQPVQPSEPDTFSVDTAEQTEQAADQDVAITAQAVIFLVWVMGVVVLSVLLIQKFIFVKALLAQSDVAAGRLDETLRQCCKQMNMRRNIQMRLSKNMLSPAACGLFRPMILMPAGLLANLTREKLRAVLIHELAHIKRGDLWVNFIQTILQIIYFYNPLLWLANALIRNIREKAVDEMVLARLGDKADSYSSTLIDIAEIAFSKPHFSLRLVGVVESKKALSGRIKHILTKPFPKSAKLGLSGLALVAVLGAILLPMARADKTQNVLREINEELNISDKAGKLTIHSLYMAPPEGKRLLWPNNTSLNVTITNSSKEIAYLGLQYYADSGTAGYFFSPGVTSPLPQIKSIPPGWSGTIEYSIKYPRFTKNGLIDIKLAKCADATTARHLPSDAEVLHEKKYYLYSENDISHSLLPSSNSDEKSFRAKADMQNQESSIATLANGVTVELVGICEHPSEGKQWWRPDGAVLDDAPFDSSSNRVTPSSNYRAYDFAIRYTNIPDGMDSLFYAEPSRASSGGSLYATVKKNGEELHHYQDGRLVSAVSSLATLIHKDEKTCTVRVGVSDGPWTTRYESGKSETGRFSVSGRADAESGVVFGRPMEEDQQTWFPVTFTIDTNLYEVRIIAVGQDGKVHKPVRTQGARADEATQRTVCFDSPVDELSAVQLQVRPYEWVEFKDVALGPNVDQDSETISTEPDIDLMFLSWYPMSSQEPEVFWTQDGSVQQIDNRGNVISPEGVTPEMMPVDIRTMGSLGPEEHYSRPIRLWFYNQSHNRYPVGLVPRLKGQDMYTGAVRGIDSEWIPAGIALMHDQNEEAKWPEFGDIKISYAVNDWQTIADFDTRGGREREFAADEGIQWFFAETDDGLDISLRFDEAPDHDRIEYRYELVGRDEEHQHASIRGLEQNGQLETYSYKTLRPSDLGRVKIQSRPRTTKVFEHIALRPDIKTDVEVITVTDKPEVASQETAETIGKLEFRVVPSLSPQQANEIDYPESDADGYKWLPARKEDDPDRERPWYTGMPYRTVENTVYGLVSDKTDEILLADGTWGLQDVYETSDPMGRPVVGFDFDEKGADLFYRLTSQHTGKRLAIIIDGVIYSAPAIQSAVRGKGVITGHFDEAEIDRLVHLLQSGMPPEVDDL